MLGFAARSLIPFSTSRLPSVSCVVPLRTYTVLYSVVYFVAYRRFWVGFTAWGSIWHFVTSFKDWPSRAMFE